MLLLLLAEDSGKWIVRKNGRALWPRGRRGLFPAGFLLQPSRSIYSRPALARFFKPPRRAAPLRCLKICGASMVCSLCPELFFLPAFCAALTARARARRGALARRACFPALLSVLLLYRDLQAALTSKIAARRRFALADVEIPAPALLPAVIIAALARARARPAPEPARRLSSAFPLTRGLDLAAALPLPPPYIFQVEFQPAPFL